MLYISFHLSRANGRTKSACASLNLTQEDKMSLTEYQTLVDDILTKISMDIEDKWSAFPLKYMQKIIRSAD